MKNRKDRVITIASAGKLLNVDVRSFHNTRKQERMAANWISFKRKKRKNTKEATKKIKNGRCRKIYIYYSGVRTNSTLMPK